MSVYVYRPLLREGVKTLHELAGEEEIEHDRNRLKRLRMVIKAFHPGKAELATTLNEDLNVKINLSCNEMGKNGNWLKLNKSQGVMAQMARQKAQD